MRARGGVTIEAGSEELIQAIFFLASPDVDPGRHLRILAQLASRIDEDGFIAAWLAADSEQKLKEALIRDERMLALRLRTQAASSQLIGRRLSDLGLPDGTLVAMIRRSGELVIPSGATTLCEGDRLTVIGRPEGIDELRQAYGEPILGG